MLSRNLTLIVCFLLNCLGCAGGQQTESSALIQKLRAKYGNKATGEIYSIQMVNSATLRELAPLLHSIPELRVVSIAGKPIDAIAMTLIAKANQIEELRIQSADITNEEMLALKPLTNLKKLSITNCAIDDEALAAFQHCKKLEFISIMATQITGAGLSNFAKSDNLKELQLDDNPVVDESLDIVREFNKLERLSLERTNVTKEGVFKLVDMPFLQILAPPEAFPRSAWKDFAEKAIKARHAARDAGELTASDKLVPGAAMLEDWR